GSRLEQPATSVASKHWPERIGWSRGSGGLLTRRRCGRLEQGFLGNDPRRVRALDTGGQGRDVALAHPSEEAKHLAVEETNLRMDLPDRKQSAFRYLARPAEYPALDGSAVERDGHEATGTRLVLFLQQIRERSVD